jgi:hypothetical protein
LRTSGYNGIHRCGVTLLSGPPQKTIFVSAAHCNFVCKNAASQVVETCCCLEDKNQFSCKNSDFCGKDPKLILAEPGDLQIACNLTNLETVPKGISPLEIILLNIEKIQNHENYDPTIGPLGGYDISVYFVNDTDFKMNKDYVWPACLPQPQNSYIPGNRGIIAGWKQPLPTYVYSPLTFISEYQNANLREREALYEVVKCSDPKWMESNTYYPPGTVCYSDVALASSVQFGNSGSGIVKPFIYENKTVTRYSWAGALSLSKGADYPIIGVFIRDQKLYSANPTVFTDARCYMSWIAAQYGLVLAEGFPVPDSCYQSSGSKENKENRNCRSRKILSELVVENYTSKCNFNADGAGCLLYGLSRLKPGPSSNFFYCNNTEGKEAVCANDCPGVDPNAVVVGGTALLLAPLAAATIVAPNLAGPALGAGSIFAAMGLGRVAMNERRTACPPGQCRALMAQRCCRLVPIRGQQLCPSFC